MPGLYSSYIDGLSIIDIHITFPALSIDNLSLPYFSSTIPRNRMEIRAGFVHVRERRPPNIKLNASAEIIRNLCLLANQFAQPSSPAHHDFTRNDPSCYLSSRAYNHPQFKFWTARARVCLAINSRGADWAGGIRVVAPKQNSEQAEGDVPTGYLLAAMPLPSQISTSGVTPKVEPERRQDPELACSTVHVSLGDRQLCNIVSVSPPFGACPEIC